MPRRILFILYNLDVGGIQTWLVRLLKALDTERYQIDVLVYRDKDTWISRHLEQCGITVTRLPGHGRPLAYRRHLRAYLNAHPPYDVIHSNTSFHSGFDMWIARQAAIPVRISHIHTDVSRARIPSGPVRRLYQAAMRRLITRHATHRVAVSRQAGEAFFGRQWHGATNAHITALGINFAAFRNNTDIQALRSQLGIPHHARVIGHVGRFSHAKNHAFLLEVFAAAHTQDPTLHLLLVGSGELEADIRAQADTLGITESLTFAGTRTDIAAWLGRVCDGFCFPSHYEGLGQALVEAQAANLPCLTSDTVPEESTIIPELVTRLPLDADVTHWAHTLLALSNAGSPLTYEEAIRRAEAGIFSLRQALASIEKLYSHAEDDTVDVHRN